MGIRLDEMLIEIENRLDKDYKEALWTGRILKFVKAIKEDKDFKPDLIVHSHFAMTLMDLQRLKEIAKKDSLLEEFCNESKEDVHAQLIGWLVAPYMANWFTNLNLAY